MGRPLLVGDAPESPSVFLCSAGVGSMFAAVCPISFQLLLSVMSQKRICAAFPASLPRVFAVVNAKLILLATIEQHVQGAAWVCCGVYRCGE